MSSTSISSSQDSELSECESTMSGIMAVVYPDPSCGVIPPVRYSDAGYLQECKLSIEIFNTVAEIQMCQRYKNNTDQAVEAYLIIPKKIPEMHIISLEFDFENNRKRKIKGSIMSLEKAHRDYEKYLDQHNAHAKYISSESDFYKIRAGTLAVGTGFTATLKFTSELKPQVFESFNYELVIPRSMYLAESYLGMRDTPVKFLLTVHFKGSVKDCFSPTHQKFEHIAESISTSELSDEKKKPKILSYVSSLMQMRNQDFVLKFILVDNSNKPTFITESHKLRSAKGFGSVLLHMSPEPLVPQFGHPQADIVVVIAAYGRYGIFIKEALEQVLRCVPENCSINFVFEPWRTDKREKSKPASDELKKEVLTRFNKLQKIESYEDSHTYDLLETLKEGFSCTSVEGVPRRIILITDAEMNEFTMADFDKVWQLRPANCALFTISAGQRSPLLEEMAEVGFGISTYMKECSDSSRAQVSTLVAKATQFDIKEVSLTWKNAEGHILAVKKNAQDEGICQVPAVVNCLYEGAPLEVFVVSDNAILLPKYVEICIKSPGKIEDYTLKVTGVPISPGGLSHLAIGKMLNENSPERQDMAYQLGRKCGMLFEDSTIVGIGTNRMPIFNNYVLPTPFDFDASKRPNSVSELSKRRKIVA